MNATKGNIRGFLGFSFWLGYGVVDGRRGPAGNSGRNVTKIDNRRCRGTVKARGMWRAQQAASVTIDAVRPSPHPTGLGSSGGTGAARFRRLVGHPTDGRCQEVILRIPAGGSERGAMLREAAGGAPARGLLYTVGHRGGVSGRWPSTIPATSCSSPIRRWSRT